MTSTLFEIAVLLLLLVLNGVFAMAEIAIVSARKARLQQWAEAGDAGAQTALDVARDPNQFLSTVQIGITLVGIFAGAFGGATLTEAVRHGLEGVPSLKPYSAPLAFGSVVLVITFLSLVLGELAPKRIGLANAERIAVLVARPMQMLSKITAPAVAVLGWSTEGLLRLFRVRASEEPPVTEEELRLLMAQGTVAGVFEAAEQQMVESVFRLADRRVRGLLTPRSEICWIDEEEASTELLLEALHTRPRSLYPVAKGTLDHVVGVASARTLLLQYATNQQFDLAAATREPLLVPETLSALRLLDRFRETGEEMALVLDEYGGIEGLVTLADILSAVVGEMGAFQQPGAEPAVVQRADGSWLLEGLLPVDEARRLLGVKHLPEEDVETPHSYETIAGYLMERLGRLPTTGDIVEAGEFRFEVVDMDGRRVDKVLVQPLADQPATVAGLVNETAPAPR